MGLNAEYMGPRARSESTRANAYAKEIVGKKSAGESIYESRGFGSPDYRSSSIEISTGRLSKRVINVTSSATVVRDTYSPVPNLTSYPSAIGTQGQGYRVTSSLGSRYIGGYSYAYGTTSNSSLFAPARYRTPSPVRYSVQPRFRSRFYN